MVVIVNSIFIMKYFALHQLYGLGRDWWKNRAGWSLALSQTKTMQIWSQPASKPSPKCTWMTGHTDTECQLEVIRYQVTVPSVCKNNYLLDCYRKWKVVV